MLLQVTTSNLLYIICPYGKVFEELFGVGYQVENKEKGHSCIIDIYNMLYLI